MNGESLSRALNSLPEEMIEAAMAPAPGRRRPLWRPAACAAVLALALLCGLFWPTGDGIKTAPGILTVTVYALDETNADGYSEIQLTEGISIPADKSWPLHLSIMPGLPVGLSIESEDYPAEDITFDITVEHGEYINWRNPDSEQMQWLPSTFVSSNNTRIYWSTSSDMYEDYESTEYDQIYTDIIIYCGEDIIGYAVLRFDRIYSHELFEQSPYLESFYPDENIPVDVFKSVLVKSILFPKVNGEYQDISKAYVEECIKSVHAD